MREKKLMNSSWLFYFGEPACPMAQPGVRDQEYRGSRAENARGAARREYNDKDWEKIRLPHDFVNLMETDHPEYQLLHTKDRGSGWYRRYFRLEEDDRDKRILLHFDAVGIKAKIYVNSMLMYTSQTSGVGFSIDITPVARFGSDQNVVAVHCDCHDYEAWYYEAGGIYRDVYLIKTDSLAVDTWGTFAKTTWNEDGSWNLDIETEIYNNFYEEKEGLVISTVYDPAGKEAACLKNSYTFPMQQVKKTVQSVKFDKVALWSPDACNLYRLKTQISRDGMIVDEYFTDFGFRKVTFDADKGMFLNDKPFKLYGFMSQDAALGVGSAVSESMVELKLRRLKEAGSNGFRTMHQAHHPATTYWCDRYGQFMMDENRIFHASELGIEQLTRMIKRDRNSPSVLMWSVYNEEDLVTTEEGKRMYKKLDAVCKQLDPTRPVSGATSYGLFTKGAHDDYDLIGVNHQSMNYIPLHEQKPDKPIYGSEMGGFTARPGRADRGNHDGICPAYEHLENDFCIGAYVIANIIDPMCLPNESWHMTKAGLAPDQPYVYISVEEGLRNYDPEDSFSTKRTIVVVNNGDTVELFQNGESLGKKASTIYAPPLYEVDLEAGSLNAIVHKNGELWGKAQYTLPGKPAGIKLELQNLEVKGDNEDVAIVNAYIVDSEGSRCVESGIYVDFAWNEAGEWVSGGTLGSRHIREQGNTGGYMGPHIDVVRGVCQGYIRSLAVEGDLVISASAEGLAGDTLVIKRSKVEAAAAVPETPSNYISDWKISGVYVNDIDEDAIMREADPTDWAEVFLLGVPNVFINTKPSTNSPHFPVKMEFPYQDSDTLWAVYHAKAVIPDIGEYPGKKLALLFEGFDGIGNAYVVGNGKKAGASQKENSPWPGHYRPELLIDCSAFSVGEEVEVWGFMSDSCRTSGISWPVRWVYVD
ncbi:MAG: DUF4982 domain-containing protein [Christensenellaceae bacterium]|nr:DUF4982 domain-containing protein [Christensenellaceae bacterium]